MSPPQKSGKYYRIGVFRIRAFITQFRLYSSAIIFTYGIQAQVVFIWETMLGCIRAHCFYNSYDALRLLQTTRQVKAFMKFVNTFHMPSVRICRLESTFVTFAYDTAIWLQLNELLFWFCTKHAGPLFLHSLLKKSEYNFCNQNVIVFKIEGNFS